MDRKSRGQNSALSVLPCALLPPLGLKVVFPTGHKLSCSCWALVQKTSVCQNPFLLVASPKEHKAGAAAPCVRPRQLDQEHGSPAYPRGQVSCETLSRGAVLSPLRPPGNQAG